MTHKCTECGAPMVARSRRITKEVGPYAVPILMEDVLSCTRCHNRELTAQQLGEAELLSARAVLTDTRLELPGAVLKTVRRILGFTQAQMGVLLELAAETVSRTETSERHLTWQMRYALLGLVELEARAELDAIRVARGLAAA